MSFDTLVTAIIEHNNNQVDEFNELFDTCEQLGADNAALLDKKVEADRILAAQHEAIKVNHEKNKRLETELNKVLIVADRVKNYEHEIKVMKKELKTLKEQNKRQKAASVEKDKKIKRLEKGTQQSTGIKADKEGFIINPDLGWLYTVLVNTSNELDEVLQVYPHKLDLRHEDGTITKQLTLLYTDKRGSYITAVLENDELVWSAQLMFDDNTPDRTKKLAEKFTLKPSSEVCDFAKDWLYRVNVMQSGKLRATDLNRATL